MAEALVSRIIEQLASIAGVGEAVQSLLSNFQAIEPVLEDAECRLVNETAVRHWLLKLKDTSNDIDDVLDEWNTGMKEVENAYKPSRKVRSLNLCNGFCYRPVVPHYDIAVKIKNLSKTLDAIAREKDRFSFSLTSGTRELKPPMTTSVIDVSKVRGRDEEKKTIIDLLLGSSSQEKMSLPIISILGTGGVGKTTLARLVFNEVKVDAHFDKRIWVCFSDPVDEIRVAKAILESFRDVVSAVAAFDTLLRHIEKSVKGKKFLLVLDDVWSGNPTKWEELVSTLKFGSPESRILVTTRKEDVAKMMRTTSMILLAKLPDNDCWSLFSQIAFSGRTTEECQKLTDIGRMIADKCNGLPLAAKTSGSLLSLKTTMEQWKTVLDSEIWKVEDVEKGLLPPLVISYFDLPSIVRRCFSYCAIFPKGYEINKDHLIKLWIAQGYLKVEGREDMELIGEECFENLATRSFFQDFERREYDGSIISCKMHDIVHDFAQFLAQPMCNETKLRSLSIVHKSNSSTIFPG